MFFLVALSLCVSSSFAAPNFGYAPAPVVTSSGHLADTPEVAAAKAAHFAEHAKRGNHQVNVPYYGASSHYASSYVQAYSAPSLYHNLAAASYHVPLQQKYKYVDPPANIIVKPDGFLADTPEVAAAKAAHFAEKSKVPVHSHEASYASSAPYYAPNAHNIVPISLPVADTPEVAHAKAVHLAEHAAVEARNAHAAASDPHHNDEYESAEGIYDYSHEYQYIPAHPSPSYYAPPPVITSTGHLADTPEVAHAKAAHLAEHAAVAHRHKRSIHYPLAAAYPYVSAEPHISYTSHVVHPVESVQESTVVHGPHAISSAHQVSVYH